MSLAAYVHIELHTDVLQARLTVQDLHAGGSCGHEWEMAEERCNEAEYKREVLRVSLMLVGRSRFDWMALMRI